MNFFLRLRHWQLFLLLYVFPAIFMGYAFWQTFLQENPFAILVFLPWMGLYFLFVFIGWHWTLGNRLHSKLPESVRMNLNLFRVFQLYPVVYIVAVIWFVLQMIGLFRPADVGDPAFPIAFIAIIPFHLFAVFCSIYSLWFIAKCLKSVELQQEVAFSDYILEIVLIWFLPIGIWFIQPRINAIFEDRQPSDEFRF